jgi:hypothetical protein
LRNQKDNIETALQNAKKLSSMLNVKAPEVSDNLKYYLPRKGNVIELLLSTTEDLKASQSKDFWGHPYGCVVTDIGSVIPLCQNE